MLPNTASYEVLELACDRTSQSEKIWRPIAMMVAPVILCALQIGFTPPWLPRQTSTRHLQPQMQERGQTDISENACVLPIYDYVPLTEDNRRELEYFRISLIAVPVLLPIAAFYSYDLVTSTFHAFVTFARPWFAVDGGAAEVELITPVINGVVQPAVVITLATLVASTVNSLRSRQVAIRANLNMEACDLRSLGATVDALYGGDSERNQRRRCTLLSTLRQYVNRIIIESRARSVGTDVSVWRSAKPAKACGQRHDDETSQVKPCATSRDAHSWRSNRQLVKE
jgi:hypothetical protein